MVTSSTENSLSICNATKNDETTEYLHALAERLEKELGNIRFNLFPLATSPDRLSALAWAQELKRNGFAQHELKKIQESL